MDWKEVLNSLLAALVAVTGGIGAIELEFRRTIDEMMELPVDTFGGAYASGETKVNNTQPCPERASNSGFQIVSMKFGAGDR